MKTITIIEGVTLTATQSTIDTFLAEKREAEWEARTKAWLSDPANESNPDYAEVYKDVYGIRPSWLWS